MTSNLVDNALRYNVSSGTMHVRTETVDGTARLTVSNSGPPITADDLERLFEPFQRVNGRIAYGDGFGLGLSIVRAVATSHGGTVLADPRPGGGLVVRVTLPSG
jgi:signal transduction histidine kinase